MKATGRNGSARYLAVEVMRRVHRGAFAAPSLSSAMARLEDGRERSLLTDLVYGTLRHQILLDGCLAPRLSAPERLPRDVLISLRLASYELLIRGTPAHAAVDEWVRIVKSLSPRLGGLANAVLRRVEMPNGLPRHLRNSLPRWLDARFQELLGEAAEAAGRGMLEPEPLWLSTFPGRKPHDEQATEALTAEGCEVRLGPFPGTLSVRSPKPLADLRAFDEGLVQPQNPASRLPAMALAVQPGERVLDLASGNGIKAAQLAAMGARVHAVELDPAKVERARSNLARLGLEAEHTVADLRQSSELEPASKVLLDAPCSGTGTLRGNPEIKLRLSESDVEELAALQRELLETAASLTAPGGRLVYSVCALTPEEGPHQIERFLEAHPEFHGEFRGEFRAGPLDLPLALHDTGAGGVVLPVEGLDGFFIARLDRLV